MNHCAILNHFTIFAHGRCFDPEAYLSQSPLTFDSVWHRGDLRGCPEFIQDEHPTSGIEKILGNGAELLISDQCRIASEFLEHYENEMLELSDFPGVDTFVLGLHYRTEMNPGHCVFSMSPSPRLMYFALKTRVELTFYIDVILADEGISCCDM